jgi:hypothetical protein
MAYPKFELVHLVPAAPILAVAAGEAFASARLAAPPLRLAAAIPVALIGLEAAFLATDTSAGEIAFWSSKEDDAIVRALAALPPAPLYLYGPDQNLFIRSGRVPPGRLYANPDLWYQLRAENLEDRQIAALRDHPETIVLSGGPGTVDTGDSGKRLERWLEDAFDRMPERGGLPRLVPKRHRKDPLESRPVTPSGFPRSPATP